MANFWDAGLEHEYYYSVGIDYYWQWPRHEKARIQESRAVREPRVYVFLRGGHAAPDGDTLHDVVSLSIRMGFDGQQYADATLATSNCVIEAASAGMTRAPKVGDEVYVALGVDPSNLLFMFRGDVENVKEGAAGRSYVLSCFDPLRRLREYPFAEPSDTTDVGASYDLVSGGDEDGLPVELHRQIDSLLSAADVLTHSGTGILQYPIVENDRATLWEELSDLLRSAQLVAYLSPGGELQVTYSDGNPIWSTTRMSDLGKPPNQGWTLTQYTTLDLMPYRSTVALWPNRRIGQRPSEYPDWYYIFANKPAVVEPFRFTPHNVVDVVAIESSLVVNEVRSRTTPESNLRDFIDLSALTFEELETLQFSQLGEGSTSDAAINASVAEYGLRYRTYSLGGLAEIPRGTQSAAGFDFGRYTLDRGSYSEAQVLERAFPHQRIQIRSPGILSLLPFEIVEVNLPDEGFQGLYMIEGRRLDISAAGFRTTDTLRYVGVPQEHVTLDVRG